MLNPWAPPFELSLHHHHQPIHYILYEPPPPQQQYHFDTMVGITPPRFLNTIVAHELPVPPYGHLYSFPPILHQQQQHPCTCTPPIIPLSPHYAVEAVPSTAVAAAPAALQQPYSGAVDGAVRSGGGGQWRARKRYARNNKSGTRAVWLPRSLSESSESGSSDGKVMLSQENAVCGVGGSSSSLEFEGSSFEADERTTVMIRNVPNRLSREMLIRLLDVHCAKENEMLCTSDTASISAYDFIYLPMDFKSKCNLGYAFVNFTNPAGARRLYKYLHSQCWNMFASRKIAHVCFARIQGKRALVSHFTKSCFRCDSDEYLPAILSPPRTGPASSSPATTIGSRPC